MMDVQNNGKEITVPAFAIGVESNDIRKFFVLKGEHKRKWTAKNPSNHIGVCLKIDGGLITDGQEKKCDGGLLLDDNRLFLVEFKGNGYPDAVVQLVKTKEYFLKNHSKYNLIFHARVVGKSFPKAGTELQNAKKTLKKIFGANFILFENLGVETI